MTVSVTLSSFTCKPVTNGASATDWEYGDEIEVELNTKVSN